MVNSFSILGCDFQATEDLLGALKNFEDFHCVNVCRNESEAFETILKQFPAIVFIDVDKKGRIGDPFKFIHELHQYLEVLPAFIAFSSSKRMAYEVLKNNFQDYLLRPFTDLDLRKTLLKFRKRKKQQESEKICLRSYSDYQFLDLNDILYLKADNNTSDFHLLDGKKVSAFKTLKYFEKNLPDNFLRVHHSYIVNTLHVTRISFGKSHIFLKGDAPNIPFSKSYKPQVDQLKEGFFNTLSLVV